MTNFTNNDDIIDSRDIIERLDELEQRAELAESDENECLDDDEQMDLEALRSLDEDGRQYCPDWTYGVTLIRDSYFTEYAQDLAEDIGAVPRDAQWPVNLIDWDDAAEKLQEDYTCLDFDGVDYWAR